MTIAQHTCLDIDVMCEIVVTATVSRISFTYDTAASTAIVESVLTLCLV